MKKPFAKIVSKEEAFWNEIKESSERDIERLERLLKFQKEILKLSLIKIDEEKLLNA